MSLSSRHWDRLLFWPAWAVLISRACAWRGPPSAPWPRKSSLSPFPRFSRLTGLQAGGRVRFPTRRPRKGEMSRRRVVYKNPRRCGNRSKGLRLCRLVPAA